MARNVVFSAVKNEGSTLLEWVAYHRLIGFDTIYVASNDCTDGTDDLLDALEHEGLIARHLRHDPDPRFGPQKSAIEALKSAKLLQDGDWFIFLDADEYLNIHLGDGTVDDLVTAISPRMGMIIPWRLFGDGGTRGIVERHVDANFSMAQTLPPGKPSHVKSIYRYRPGVLDLVYGNMHRPHIAKPGQVGLGDFMLAGPVGLDPDRELNQQWIAGTNTGGTAYVSADEFSVEYAQINHYSVRNPDMFELKQRRGRGFFRKKAADAKPRARHNEKFYREHNLNEVRDTSILRHKAELDRLLEDYTKRLGIRKSHERSVMLIKRELDLESENASPNEIGASSARIHLDKASEEIFLPAITLPDAEADYLRQYYRDAKTILEYGSGGSTVFAASQAHAPKVYSIESDQAWSAKLKHSINQTFPDADVDIRHVDIGPTVAWGRPKNHNSFMKYPDYAFGIYDDPNVVEPDLILIDGRFRVGCFYAALFRMSKPVTILWDDYTNRKSYHVVEKYFKPAEVVGRMVRFEITPMPLPIGSIVEIAKSIFDPR